MTLKQEAVKQGRDAKDELSELQGGEKRCLGLETGQIHRLLRTCDDMTPSRQYCSTTEKTSSMFCNSSTPVKHVSCSDSLGGGGRSKSLDPQFARLPWNIKLGPRRGPRS